MAAEFRHNYFQDGSFAPYTSKLLSLHFVQHDRDEVKGRTCNATICRPIEQCSSNCGRASITFSWNNLPTLKRCLVPETMSACKTRGAYLPAIYIVFMFQWQIIYALFNCRGEHIHQLRKLISHPKIDIIFSLAIWRYWIRLLVDNARSWLTKHHFWVNKLAPEQWLCYFGAMERLSDLYYILVCSSIYIISWIYRSYIGRNIVSFKWIAFVCHEADLGMIVSKHLAFSDCKNDCTPKAFSRSFLIFKGFASRN